jgi:hypothetical protein
MRERVTGTIGLGGPPSEFAKGVHLALLRIPEDIDALVAQQS